MKIKKKKEKKGLIDVDSFCKRENKCSWNF